MWYVVWNHVGWGRFEETYRSGPYRFKLIAHLVLWWQEFWAKPVWLGDFDGEVLYGGALHLIDRINALEAENKKLRLTICDYLTERNQLLGFYDDN